MPLQDILTPRRVHLLGGVSDAGKTSFIIPAMMAWTMAPPWVYVVGDRTLEEAQEKMRAMNLDPLLVPTLPAFGTHNISSWAHVKHVLRTNFKGVKIVVLEGFQDLCPGTLHRAEVRGFLSDVSAACEDQDWTVLGVVESPKLKPTEKYTNPRQRISGASAWGYHSSSIMLIEAAEKNAKDEFTTPNRVMWICHKTQPRRCINGCFTNDNQLVFPAL